MTVWALAREHALRASTFEVFRGGGWQARCLRRPCTPLKVYTGTMIGAMGAESIYRDGRTTTNLHATTQTGYLMPRCSSLQTWPTEFRRAHGDFARGAQTRMIGVAPISQRDVEHSGSARIGQPCVDIKDFSRYTSLFLFGKPGSPRKPY